MTASQEGSRERSSDARRRPTDDPMRFLIPAAQVAPRLAERVASPPSEPAPALPAATVVLAREGEGGVEVLLLRRPEAASFAAGHWVFPGGRVDPEDHERARRLGLSDDGAYPLAAVRETREETGIVLAAPDALIYLARWITPEPEPRRFDARFFLARVAPDARCVLPDGELEEARWISPESAARRAATGEMPMLPPTLHTLRRLAGSASLDRLCERLRGEPAPSFLPRMRLHPDGIMLEIHPI